MTGTEAAQAEGLARLARMVDQEASVRGFNDCFFLATVIVLAALVPLLWLRSGHKSA